MKYTAEAFDEWWFTTQFDRAYWQVNSQKHQTEYKWAKLAWDAARRGLLEEVERLNRVFANQGNLREEIVELKSQLQSAQTFAASLQEVIADHKKLVRDMDIELNGENTARKASLYDLVAQCMKIKADNYKLYTLAAQRRADQALLVAQERKMVARKCAEMCEPWGVADKIRTRYGLD